MVSFPNAKINLGLTIIRKREDGFHDLETVFYPIKNLRDALEVIRNTTNTDDPVSFQSSGLNIQGAVSDNLCIKAYRLLQKDYTNLPPVDMHLHKTIPMGAGLGGGSADGAFTLRLLNQMFQLGIPQERLIQYALELGSDCPFFIFNEPCFATGRGEQMESVPVDLSQYQCIIINPRIHVPTGWAFQQLTPRTPSTSCRTVVAQPVSTWKEQLINDFEEPVFQAYPVIGEIKQQLYRQGAVYASMTGTGSTVYGLFDKNEQPSFHFPNTYFVHEVVMESTFLQ